MPRITEVFIPLPLSLAVAALLLPPFAQARVAENIHYDHAPVLQAQPVIQTVQATQPHEDCAGASVSTSKLQSPAPGLLQQAYALLASPASADFVSPEHMPPADTAQSEHCQRIEAGSYYQRIVAWEVDYIYQGKKYRSRLPMDPGSCVRLRISITPLLEAELPSKDRTE